MERARIRLEKVGADARTPFASLWITPHPTNSDFTRPWPLVDRRLLQNWLNEPGQDRARLQGKDEAMQQALKPRTPRVLVFFLITASAVFAIGQTKASENPSASAPPIRGKEHYVMRDGLRIYLWENTRKATRNPSPTRARSHSSSMEARGRVAHSLTCGFVTIR